MPSGNSLFSHAAWYPRELGQKNLTLILSKSVITLLNAILRKEVNWCPILKVAGCVAIKAAYITWICIFWWFDQINALLELLNIITQPTHFVPGVGITAQLSFSGCPPFRYIFLRPHPLSPMILALNNFHMCPLITRVQVVAGIVSHNMLQNILTEPPEVHGCFHLPCLLQITFSTLQVNFIISYNIQIICMQHSLVWILKTVVWHNAVLDEVVNSVNLVLHSNVQIPGLIHVYVPQPFVFTRASLLNGFLLLTLFHHVRQLNFSVICGLEGCLSMIIFVSSLWSLLLIRHHNRVQLSLFYWVLLGVRSIPVHALGRYTLCKHVILYRNNQTKPFLPWILKYHILGEVVVPKNLWFCII